MIHAENHTLDFPAGSAMTDKPQQELDTPGVAVRPPRLYLGALAVGIVADTFAPGTAFPVWLSFGVGAMMIVVGIAFLALSVRRFSRAGTNVPTNQPTTALVTDGLHRYSRNPIYVALTLIYVGIALAAASIFALILLVPVLLVMRYGVIAREERYLEGKFSDDYRAYKACTRRWL